MKSSFALPTARGRSFVEYLSSSRGREAGEISEWRPGRQSTRIEGVVQKLQATGCPYLEGMEEPVVKEVILTPGEARMRLLTWLTGRVHPSFQYLSADSSSVISTAPKLATLLHDLGLCQKEDHELILGTDASSRQLLFLDALLDLALMAEWGENTLTDKLQSVPWQMERCCQFMDDLSQHEDLSAVFPSSISLVPPGISIAAGGVVPSGRDMAGNDTKKTMPPSLSELEQRRGKLRDLVEEKQLQVEAIMEEVVWAAVSLHTYTELKPDALESCHKMIAVSLETLAQLATSFCHTYEEEIQPWCSTRDAPPTSSLGLVCQRVDHLKTDMDKLFQALEMMQACYHKLDSLKTSGKLWNEGDVCVSAHQTLKDCLAVLSA